MLRSLIFLLSAAAVSAQETRSTISGRVIDPQGQSIVGAEVVVTNSETRVAIKVQTNETGYYEAPLLLPGRYSVRAAQKGFQRVVRDGITVQLASRIDVDLELPIGSVTESVTVTAEAPLVDVSSGSSGRVLDNRTQTGLPASFGQLTALTRLTPGVQFNGGVAAVDAVSQGSTGAFYLPGNVGGNQFSMDGGLNMSINRFIAYLPHADTIAEMKVETGGFDPAIGQTSGLQVNVMTKSGTNAFHGSANFARVENRWNGTGFFARQLYYRSIAAAEARGDTAGANALRNTPKQSSGHWNDWVMTISGPVRIPKLYDGRNKTFFFLSGLGRRWITYASGTYYTFPTMANRQGDFSQLLQVDPIQYQIYDPYSIRRDPARPNNFIRDPIPGNILARSRIINPMYKFYSELLPVPNADPINPRIAPTNNYLGLQVPIRDSHDGMSARLDQVFNQRHRAFGRFLWDDFLADYYDWTVTTRPGTMTSGATRRNLSLVLDWIYTPTPTTLIDFNMNDHWYQVNDGAAPGARSIKPSDTGLPKYLDEIAGARSIMPPVTVTGYPLIGLVHRFPTVAQYFNPKIDISHIRGNHTLRAGVDVRIAYRTGGNAGNPAGNFSFANNYVRRNDDTLTPAAGLGLSWATFMMGLGTGGGLDILDTYALRTNYTGWYFHDSWRVTRRLTLNLGLRMEYEMGPIERYNRMLTNFDEALPLPIAGAATQAYAAAPIPELPVSQFKVVGGTRYAGLGGASRRLVRNELMYLPRISAAYAIDRKTVLRGGYGVFYDTINVFNIAPDQTGYTGTTPFVSSNNFGQTWLTGDPANGISPMVDPFPLRADGTRFVPAVQNAYGTMALAGGAFSSYLYDTPHVRQQRWRASVQRQFGANLVVEAAYVGYRANNILLNVNRRALPEQYWSKEKVRDTAILNNLNQNVTNPFFIGNLSAFRAADPVTYDRLSRLNFFASRTISKATLLRPLPQHTAYTPLLPAGENKTQSIELTLDRRFAHGFNLYSGYTYARNRARDYFFNEFDPKPSWIENANARPHRFFVSTIAELPFGKGKPLLSHGPGAYVLGGWQVSLAYELQPGALIGFGNVFYYGDLKDIRVQKDNWEQWITTAGFETSAAKAPSTYNARTFPVNLPGVRMDMMNNWNGNLQRTFNLGERVRFQARLDALNLLNRTQKGGVDTNPVSSTFGRVAGTVGVKRWIQISAKLSF